MLDKLKKLLEFSSKTGMWLPAAYDNQSNGPSVTLWFAHISFYLATISIILLIAADIKQGVIAASIFSALYTIFYLLRRLSKAKIDLNDGELELDNGGEETAKEKE